MTRGAVLQWARICLWLAWIGLMLGVGIWQVRLIGHLISS